MKTEEGARGQGDTGTRGGNADTRARGPERDRAKVQTGAELLCKSAKVNANTSGGRWRPFGHRVLAPGFRRLKADRLTPERLTTVAATRHME